MLESDRPNDPSMQAPSTRIDWRPTMAIPAILILTGLALFGTLGVDDEPSAPAAPPAERALERRAIDPDSTRDVKRPVDASNAGSRPNSTPAAAGRISSERPRRDAGSSSASLMADAPSAAARELQTARSRHAAASSMIDEVTAKGTDKPDLPSGGLVFSRSTYDAAEVAAEASDTTRRRFDISRLGYIELTAAEASKLDVVVGENTLELLADDLKDAQLRVSSSNDRITLLGNDGASIKRFKLEIDRESARFGPVDIARDEQPLRIAPVVIVCQQRRDLHSESSSLFFFKNAPTLVEYDGRATLADSSYRAFRRATQQNPTVDGINAAMSHALGRLVPVYFRFDEGIIDGTNIRKGSDVCLWYAPTKEFLDALPERYRVALESELSVMREVAEEHGTVEQACDRIAGRPSYLEVCRVSSGAVNAATASPNPAHGRTTVAFRLSEARRVSVTLHDLNGRYLRHLVFEEDRSAGDQRVEADLDGVSQGAYLVAVRTSQGEQAVARLIVQ